jgi:hypothetical protein
MRNEADVARIGVEVQLRDADREVAAIRAALADLDAVIAEARRAVRARMMPLDGLRAVLDLRASLARTLELATSYLDQVRLGLAELVAAQQQGESHGQD